MPNQQPQHPPLTSQPQRLPKLSDLEKDGYAAAPQQRQLADASRLLSPEDESLKRELLFRFDLLRKSYKNQNIPTFTIHSDLKTMEHAYEDVVRRLSLDSSVENYKKYLIGGFMLLEYVMGKWFNLDMKGYTQQQIEGINNYEKLLIEIGERQSGPGGDQWSVEVRLIFLVVINTGFFLVGQMIIKKTGANLLGTINNMNKKTQSEPPKRKMAGPSINIEDLPDVANIS